MEEHTHMGWRALHEEPVEVTDHLVRAERTAARSLDRGRREPIVKQVTDAEGTPAGHHKGGEPVPASEAVGDRAAVAADASASAGRAAVALERHYLGHARVRDQEGVLALLGSGRRRAERQPAEEGNDHSASHQSSVPEQPDTVKPRVPVDELEPVRARPVANLPRTLSKSHKTLPPTGGGAERNSMSEVSAQAHRVSVEVGGTEITFETGKLAKQASGAVVVRAGDTMVLGTATAGNLRDVDFLPLTVDVEERMYAAGKIPGSFFKREGRAGEKGTLTARMIDRPLRPLFPKGWRFETQLVSIPLSIDHVHPYDILAMNGASAALMISDIPLPTPVGAVRIGKIDGNFVVNPNEEDLLENTELDLVVAGTEEAILMVEAGANEIPEAEILDALDIAHSEIKKLCAIQHELREKAGKPKTEIAPPQIDQDLLRQIRESHGSALDQATAVHDKLDRQDATKAVEEQVLEQYSGAIDAPEYPVYRQRAQLAFDKLEKQIIRQRIAVEKKRPDGRAEKEIRPISIEAGLLPRTHGPALFTRGQTQAISVAALGTLKEEMRLDTLGLETKKYYFPHYNFPPFSVGEAGFMRGPKRRDIGHGALAERALVPMIPSIEDFPYTI